MNVLLWSTKRLNLPDAGRILFFSLAFFLICSKSVSAMPVVADEFAVSDGVVATDGVAVSDSAKVKERVEWVALKNNLLYDAMLTPNLSLETRLNERWSLEMTAGFNPFPLDDEKTHKWRHLLLMVQPKYWFCGVYTRDFIAFNTAYAHYNVSSGKYPLGFMYKSILDNRYEGDALMAGLSYGWHFPVSPHFSVELELGADAGLTWYDRYECKHCGKKIESGLGFFALPKAGVNLVVLFGGDKQSLQKRCDCGLEENEPTDSVFVEPMDTVIPIIIEDTIVPVVEDTVVTVDTIVPVPVVVVPEEVAPVVDIQEVEHEEQMQRLRRGAFRPYSEYVPYTRDMVLSEDTDAIYVHFDVGQSAIIPDYMHNDEILDSIMTIMAEYMSDDSLQIRLIQIVGMASFDGTLQGNERLAQKRAQALRNYIQSEYALPDSLFSMCNGGEGWAELRWHVEQREFEGKQDVLRLIETEPNLDLRERKIKQLRGGKVYAYLKEHVTRFQRNAGNLIVFYEERNKKEKQDN